MNKNTIYNWLYCILKDYPEKEIRSICKNYTDDKIGLNYLKNQYKNNKNNFERDFLNNFVVTRNKIKNIKKDNVLIMRPAKI